MRAIENTSSSRKDLRRFVFPLLLTMVLVIAASCGSDDDSGDSGSAADDDSTESDGEETTETESVEVILGWLAEPSRGGLYAAEQEGCFEDAGLDVSLNAGTDISAVQLVGAGRAEFGIGDADELIAAREEGIPVVAVMTTFQTNPRILVYHSSNPVENFEGLADRTVYLDLGDDWWEWVKGEYGLEGVDERAYTGQLANFIEDENSLVQGYVGSEDVVLAEEGIDVGVLNVGESGFDPYTNVLFTTEDFIADNPDTVAAMVDASICGWEFYETGYADVNPFMQTFNEELTVESMNETAEAQLSYIYGGDAETEGVGYMTEERWAEIYQQLQDLGVITEEIDIDAIWTSDFLN